MTNIAVMHNESGNANSLNAERQVEQKTFRRARRQHTERFFVAFRKHAGSARIEVAIDDAIRARAIERARKIVEPIEGILYEGCD